MTKDIEPKMHEFVTQKTAFLNHLIMKEVHASELPSAGKEFLLCQVKHLTITLLITDFCFCAHKLEGWQDWVRKNMKHCTEMAISTIESKIKEEGEGEE